MNRPIDPLDPAFDHRIADWLAADPDRAPAELIDTILAAVPSIPQRQTMPGLPWRFPPMPSLGKLALMAVAVLAVGLVGPGLLAGPVLGPAASASPTASPSAVAVPPPLTERFDSSLNGISMSYPAGWQTRPATEPWTDGVIGFGAAGADVIFDPTRGEDLYFALASEPSGGRPDHVWQDDVTLPKCPGGHAGSVLTFDGASGWVVTCGGSPIGVHSALLVNDTHGYAIVLYLGDEGLTDTYTGAWFVSVLKTLDLRAEDAPDASIPSASP